MKFDIVVLMAYIFGGLFTFMATLLRYNLSTGTATAGFLNAIKPINCRKYTPHAKAMLIQYAGVMWLLLGTGYGIISEKVIISGVWDDVLFFVVLFAPGVLLIGITILLRREYW